MRGFSTVGFSGSMLVFAGINAGKNQKNPKGVFFEVFFSPLFDLMFDVFQFCEERFNIYLLQIEVCAYRSVVFYFGHAQTTPG